MTIHRRRRIPKLRFTKLRDIGWHVSYRDADSGIPRKVRFGPIEKSEAEAQYHAWLAEHLQSNGRSSRAQKPKPAIVAPETAAKIDGLVPGNLLSVSTQILKFDEARTRKAGEPRAKGTIDAAVASDRKSCLNEFLDYLNKKHGQGSAARMLLADLAMSDVEEFNRQTVVRGLSASQVSKRLQLVKALIDRAGRPENGTQHLSWNWDSRDVFHGKPSKARRLPTVEQLKKILRSCSAREQAMVWMAIGLGFGQSDLADVLAGQIDQTSYDLRRGKTGIERFGTTPPMVWTAISAYLKKTPRVDGEPLFLTRKGQPLTHGKGDAVQQWWYKLREAIDETPETLDGFYVLRHLGATEFGSRAGSSIGDVKRWLGHAASSHIADLYMRAVAPEYRAAVEWVRDALLTGKADLREKRKGKPKGIATGQRGSRAAAAAARV